MSESANSAKSAKQIFANFVKFVRPICGTTRRSEGSVTEAEYPTNYQRISNLSLTIRPFRVAILAVLLVFVGGWNSEVWAGAGDITFYASIEASPSTGGTVSLSPGTSQTQTSSYKAFSGYQQTSATFSYSAIVANSNYVFKGWSTSSTNNSGTTDNPMSKTYYGTGNLKGNATYNADKYYAIFARVTARSTAEMAFGTKLIGVGWNEGATKSVTIDYVHAGNITATITGTNQTEFSLSSSSSSQSITVVSNNTNSETNSTITVYFKPSSEGNKSATLTISSSNGLDNITIDLTGTGQETVNPEYTCNIEKWYYVDDASIDLNSLWTSTSPATKTYSIKADSWTPAGTNNSGATVPAITNNHLSLGQAGTLTLKLTQASYTGYYSGSDEKTIEIRKRPNTIYVKGNANYSNSIYVDSYDNRLTLTADNTDYTNCPITNTQTAGSDVATFYQNDEVVYSSYKLGTATWTLSQPENYKYQAGNGSFTVNVIDQEEATDCYVLNKPDEKSIGKYGNADDTQSQTYSWSDPGSVLKFKMWKYSGANDVGNKVFIYDASGNEIDKKEYSIGSMSTSEQNYTITLPENARSVKFQNGGGTWASAGSLNTYIKAVTVSRKTWLEASNVTIDRTSTGNPVYPKDGTGVGTLTINYSLANGGDLKIINDNPKFTLDNTTISNVDCKTGTATINISYESDKAGTDVAHLVIYNKVYRKEVTVTGITAKRNQEVHWEIGDALRVGTQTENAAWVTIGSEVSYSSSNTTLLEVVDGKLVAKAKGEVTITATAPGNDEYNAVEDQKTITITNDLTQSIVWEQNFLRLQLGGANQTLNAYVVSDVEGCTTDRARLITYESSDESVVKVINSNQLQIVGAGQAVLTARQAGGVDADGHNYMAVSAEKAVIVRDPNAPCENYLYIQPQENKWYCGWNLANRQYREFVIDNLDEPSTLYLQYKGEYKTVGVDYFGGTMHVDEWYDGAWHEVPNGNLGTPSIGTYKTLNTTLQRKTTKVRIRTNDGVGYHYFKDCKIGQSRYIEASDLTTFEAKVGQVVNQQLTVRYNNITGPVTLSLGNNNSKFSLSQQSIAGDCGDKGTVDVTVSYLPTVEANEEELLTVSDGTTTLKVTLQGVATKTSRHIVWDLPETNNVHTVDVVELGAKALTDVGNTTAGDVFYAISSSSPAGVGSVAGSNLTFAKAGTVVVTANTVNDARYNDAVTVSKHYNVAITPTTISTMPVLAEVTSGTAAGEIELTGWQVTNTVNDGVVEGTLAITSADLTNVGTNTVTLTFTPSNTDMYSGCTGTTTIVVNKAVPNIFTNASGNGEWNDPANWSNDVPTGDEPDVIISGDLIIDEELTVGNLTIKKNSSLVLTVNGDLTINGASEDLTEYGNLYVANGGEVEVNGNLKVGDLTVEASIGTAKSGQVDNAENIVYANAYIEINMDPKGTMDDAKWYGFTVPFAVNAHTGVSRLEGDTYRNCTYGSHYMIAEYDANKRLNTGKGWKYLSGNTLNPGQFYFFTVNGNYNTYRFKASEASYTPAAAASLAMNGGVENANANWNGVGNSTLRHATASYTGGSYVQVYENGLDAYKTVATSEAKFVVGCPFFIQATEASTLVLDVQPGESERYYAPRRTSANQTGVARVTLGSVDGGFSDQIYVSATDREQDCYLAGHDLSKAGESKIVPQLWIDAYNQKLSVHELAWQGNEAYCAISLYAPQAGEYILTAKQPTDGTEVYLTYNGQVLWNLTSSEYVLSLEKGTTTAYGLQIVKTPAITTGGDQIDVKGQTMRKVLMNDQIYVITPEGAMYDVLGKGVKF